MAGSRRDHFEEANPARLEFHPLDGAVEQRLQHRRLRQQIFAAQDRIRDALGDDWSLFLKLEELMNQRASDREEAHFNVGYERGLVQGRADTLAATLRRRDHQGRKLAARLTHAAMNAGPPPRRALAALLEVAWGLALGSPKRPSAPKSKRAT